MVVERYDPFRNTVSLGSMIDRLFDESFLRPFGNFPPEGTLALDIAESDDAYTLKASLPGMKPEEIQITADGNTVSIKGETKRAEEKKANNYVVKERREGRYARTFTLSAAVDADKAAAKYEDGVLTLTLPKTERAKPVQITVDGRLSLFKKEK